MLLTAVVGVIAFALFFDFLNGFHDAANSIATVVSTRVLRPGQAVAWAAFFNFVAAFSFGVAVARTMGKGIVRPEFVDSLGPYTLCAMVFAALVGAVFWNLFTWYYGIPSSSSHALVGGLTGAAVAYGGWGTVIPAGLYKIGVFIVVAPVLGLILGTFFMLLVMNLFQRQRPGSVDTLFRRGQLLSAAIYSFSHGTNDAQKTMGVIAVVLYGTVWKGREFTIPLWVILSAHAAIALGTLLGGWRIVKTMGQRITKLRPVGGFCAETGGGLTILALAELGIPVSTTHTITGAIMGVGAMQRMSAVRWGVAGRIVWAWIFTLPASALVAAGALWALRLVAARYGVML